MFTYRTDSPEITVELGRRLAQFCKPGMVILLVGDLGAGKTCLAGGILNGLGVDGYVTSPTYTLVNEYQGSIPIAHFDLYRLDEPDQLFDIGFDEYLTGSWLVLIEWPERALGYLPQEYLRIELKGYGGDREIIIESIGDEYQSIDEELKNLVSLRD